jgi:hypothetical protein
MQIRRKRYNHLLDTAEPFHYVIDKEWQEFGNQIRIYIVLTRHLLPRNGISAQHTSYRTDMHPRQNDVKKCRTM